MLQNQNEDTHRSETSEQDSFELVDFDCST